jgi:hypothetical protein
MNEFVYKIFLVLLCTASFASGETLVKGAVNLRFVRFSLANLRNLVALKLPEKRRNTSET